jgi:hypothetical protein
MDDLFARFEADSFGCLTRRCLRRILPLSSAGDSLKAYQQFFAAGCETLVVPGMIIAATGSVNIGWMLPAPFNVIAVLGGILLISLGLSWSSRPHACCHWSGVNAMFGVRPRARRAASVAMSNPMISGVPAFFWARLCYWARFRCWLVRRVRDRQRSTFHGSKNPEERRFGSMHALQTECAALIPPNAVYAFGVDASMTCHCNFP